MGEPAVEVKSEDASVTKKVKLEPADVQDGVPEAKKVKLEPVDTQDGGPETTKVKLEPADVQDGVPEAKKVKLEPADTQESANVKQEENGVKSKWGNGTDEVKPSYGDEAKTAEERGEPYVEQEIVRQIEYYFGNHNLPKDKFLQEQIKLEDGWVPIDVMLRFQRLASISKNPATIVSALKSSSSLMEVNEDGSKVRRSPNKPLPLMNEEWQNQVNERTVYCKGFPQDSPSIGPYLEFFKTYGPVENINLRKYVDKGTKKLIFKGSADILFETKELAEKFLSLDSVKYDGKELIRMTHAAHVEEKKKEKDERWGKKVKKETPTKEEGKGKREFAKGCILKISDIKDEELTREVIKSTLVDLGADVAFIQFNKGEKEALVRLQSSEDGAATQFVKKLSDSGDKFKIGEEELELSTVEGEEEEKYLEQTRQNMDRSQKGYKKKHHKGGHKGFRGHKRGRSPANDNRAAKKQDASA